MLSHPGHHFPPFTGVPRGRAGKNPKKCRGVLFGTFAPWNTLWGIASQEAKNTPQALFGALPSGAGARPRPRRGPGNGLLREELCWRFVREMRSWGFDFGCLCGSLSSLVLGSCSSHEGRLIVGTSFRGPCLVIGPF